MAKMLSTQFLHIGWPHSLIIMIKDLLEESVVLHFGHCRAVVILKSKIKLMKMYTGNLSSSRGRFFDDQLGLGIAFTQSRLSVDGLQAVTTLLEKQIDRNRKVTTRTNLVQL